MAASPRTPSSILKHAAFSWLPSLKTSLACKDTAAPGLTQLSRKQLCKRPTSWPVPAESCTLHLHCDMRKIRSAVTVASLSLRAMLSILQCLAEMWWLLPSNSQPAAPRNDSSFIPASCSIFRQAHTLSFLNPVDLLQNALRLADILFYYAVWQRPRCLNHGEPAVRICEKEIPGILHCFRLSTLNVVLQSLLVMKEPSMVISMPCFAQLLSHTVGHVHQQCKPGHGNAGAPPGLPQRGTLFGQLKYSGSLLAFCGSTTRDF